jgi:fumarate reductase iron-sulfur subunit
MTEPNNQGAETSETFSSTENPEVTTVQVSVWRQEPDSDQTKGESITNAVPVAATTTVLDILDWLKAGPVPDLAYRSSCRSGVCGSCGVMVNGRPVLACETSAKGYRASGINILPLARLKVLRDLITDTDGFIARLRQVHTWLLPSQTESQRCANQPANVESESKGCTEANHNLGTVNRQTPAQLEAYRTLSECINCLLCYAACPVFDVAPDFVGPAALALARRWDLDSRDAGSEQRFDIVVEDENGIWPCTQDGSCTRVCPKGLDPKKAIGELQRAALS